MPDQSLETENNASASGLGIFLGLSDLARRRPPVCALAMAVELQSGRTHARERLTFAAPDVGLAALGLDSAELLFAPAPALSSRLEALAGEPSRARWRFPLPGTSDLRGNLTGRPGALGTGWVRLTVYAGAFGELLRARCTPPRSASLAEREWNLLCHLRAHGVGTCEPLIVGARGAGPVSARSFLVVREPEGAFPLPRWLRTDGIGSERERGLRALGLALARLARSGIELPELRPEHLLVTPSGAPGDECEAHDAPGLVRNRLPGVTLVEVRGGRLRRGRWCDPLPSLRGDLASQTTPLERARLEELVRGARSAPADA